MHSYEEKITSLRTQLSSTSSPDNLLQSKEEQICDLEEKLNNQSEKSQVLREVFCESLKNDLRPLCDPQKSEQSKRKMFYCCSWAVLVVARRFLRVEVSATYA